MEITRQLQDGQLTLAPQGRIDTVTAPELAAAITLEGVTELILDLTAVDYISSAGLRVILATRQKLAASGHKMALKGVRPIVREVFDIVGFSDVLTFI